MKSPNYLYSLVSQISRILPVSVKQALYRSPKLAKLVRGSLNRAAPQGLSEIEISGGFLTGMRMALDLSEEKTYWLGTYEVELQAAIEDLIAPGMVAYDVGANIGYVTLMLARAVGPKGKVFAFEALPENLERLRTNVTLNHLENDIVIGANAVIDDYRMVDFWLGPSGAMGKADGSAGRKELAYTQSISVKGISLDSFVYEHHNLPPQVVKMDIEGGEVMALPGMRRLLSEVHPIMFLELHGPEAARTVWDILNGLGYRICRMTPSYPVVPSLEALDWKAYLIGM